MEEELNTKDFYWNLMESQKQEIVNYLKEKEEEVDFDPKQLIEIVFPNLKEEEIFKIWSLTTFLNKYFEEENEVEEFVTIKDRRRYNS